jgi:antitoxin (DNA-binding transcriptional repressor) of toxin-antitoxin stability system
MGIHVNIGEAKDRLSQLIAAAKRGEEVVIARAGVPEVRLTAFNPDTAKLELAAKRRAFIGSMKSTPEMDAYDWFAPMSDEDLKLFYGDPLPPEFDGLSR